MVFEHPFFTYLAGVKLESKDGMGISILPLVEDGMWQRRLTS